MVETTSSLDGQIAQLEKDLQARRTALGVTESAPIDREEVQNVIGSKIEDAVQAHALTPAPNPDDLPIWESPDISEQVQELVTMAFGPSTHSVEDAVAAAVRTGNPAIIDALHDVLTDKLHDELVNRNKLNSTP